MIGPTCFLPLGDIHAGSIVGLTPPKFWRWMSEKDRPRAKLQWEFFADGIEAIRPVKICLSNGDAVHGKNGGFWGTEVFVDRMAQVEIAIAVLEFVKAERYIFTYGTRCHVSSEEGGEDFEKCIAKHFRASISAQQEFRINKTIFHAQHNIGNGKFNALESENIVNMRLSEKGERRRADVFIRSHLHIFRESRGAGWRGVVTPGLLGWDNKHGQRHLSSPSDFGFISMLVGEEKGDVQIKEHIAKGLIKAPFSRL